MTERFNKAVEENIVSEVLRILKEYPELSGKLDVILKCSKEKLQELLNAKRIDEALIEFVADEDDIKIIQRVIKLNNGNISLSAGLIEFAKDERKAEILNLSRDKISPRDAYKLYKDLNIEQMEEILKALNAGVKEEMVRRYMINLEADQMTQMRKAIKAYVCPEKLAYLYGLAKEGMPSAQLREIRKCAESGRWSNADIRWIVKRELSAEQLSYVRKSAEKIGWQEIAFMANPDFEALKIKCIGQAFEAGVSIEIVKECSMYEYRICRERLLKEQERMLSEII